MLTKHIRLSKTNILNGARCLKSLYLHVHHPELSTPITPEDQARFDEGTLVGNKAREYYPGGVLVDNVAWDFTGALSRTREFMDRSVTIIYEAAFEHQDCYARLDIIQYNATTQKWDIFEVKSSTQVKLEHKQDVAIQAWIAAGSGLPVGRMHIMHINNQCYYSHLQDLFTTVDLTEEILSLQVTLPSRIQEMHQVLTIPSVPDIDIDAYCEEPHVCPFKSHCWTQKRIPALGVFDLPRIGKKKWELYRSNILHLDDPRLTGLNVTQQRVITCFKTKKRYVAPTEIAQALQKWQFPLVFLDFETINPAIPRYEGTRPYEQIPFQFSAHVIERIDGEAKHAAFLHEKRSDPRPDLIEALFAACGTQGSIVAYNKNFEAQCIRALGVYSPRHQAALERLVQRLVDPKPVVEAAVYDTAFQGSFSLKKVAPTLLGEAYSYEGMLVADGKAAQRAFDELIDPNAGAERKVILKNAMLDYCKQDTHVMVELVRWLFKQIDGSLRN